MTGKYYSGVLITFKKHYVLFLQDNPTPDVHKSWISVNTLFARFPQTTYYLSPQEKKSLKVRKFSSNKEIIEYWFTEQQGIFSKRFTEVPGLL